MLSHFIAGKLEIKLTSEKLFINTATSSEAFALRSINGIGVIDLVDDYNIRLNNWKLGKSNTKFWIGVGVTFGILAFFIITKLILFGFSLLVIGSIISLIAYKTLNSLKENEPILRSAVRIIMGSGNRDFEFDKTGTNSGNVAEFVAMVESTLSAYHKNND